MKRCHLLDAPRPAADSAPSQGMLGGKDPIWAIMAKAGWCVDHSVTIKITHIPSKLPHSRSFLPSETCNCDEWKCAYSPLKQPLDKLLLLLTGHFLRLPNRQWCRPSTGWIYNEGYAVVCVFAPHTLYQTIKWPCYHIASTTKVKHSPPVCRNMLQMTLYWWFIRMCPGSACSISVIVQVSFDYFSKLNPYDI